MSELVDRIVIKLEDGSVIHLVEPDDEDGRPWNGTTIILDELTNEAIIS